MVIKKFIKYLVLNQLTAKALLLSMLKLHTFLYKWSGVYASILNNSIHPKHRIMRYKEWFLNNIQSDDVVLDVGCNTGMMPEVMSQKAEFVYGIEIEDKYIRVAQSLRKKSNIEYICADATTYDYSSCMPIDIVTLSNVLEHIENRVEFLRKLINQIKWNNTKRFLIRVPMLDRDWISIYKKELNIEYRLDSTHYIEYTFDEFRQELDESKIKIKSYHIQFGEIYAVCEA
jgi:SAM-dependent methyltransferase